MDYLPFFYSDYERKRTPFRFTETDTYRPRDRYVSVDRRPQTYKQQYSAQYMYYDTTDRYECRHDNGRPVRHSDLTECRRHDRHDTHRRTHQNRREESHRQGDERGSSQREEEEEGGRRRDERGSRSRDTRDEKAGQSVTCTIPTPPVDEWLVLDVWDQEETIETIFYPELWSTHMTDGDYAQMHQWEMESDSLNQTVVNNTVKATDSLPVVSRKRSQEAETTPSMAPPAKQPRIHVNKNHAGYARMMTNRSPYRNGSRF